MLNMFDFYEIVATSTRKRDLTPGLRQFPIEQRFDGWQQYGTRRFPRYTYQRVAGYVDVSAGGNTAPLVDAAIAHAQALFPNATIHARYHARD